MTTKSKNVPAITEPAQGDLFGAHVHAEKIVEATKRLPEAENFAELHFDGARVTGIIKTGNIVLKINN
jgi:hypothetical protein